MFISYICVHKSYQKQEKEAAMIARKTYALLDADDEDEDDNRGSCIGIISVDSATENKRGVSRNKRFRKEAQDENDDDEAGFHISRICFLFHMVLCCYMLVPKCCFSYDLILIFTR